VTVVELHVNTRDLVLSEIAEIRAGKGLPPTNITTDDLLLGEALGLDSLDLATLVVSLEEKTGRDPFRAGFVMFRTVSELTELFADT